VVTPLNISLIIVGPFAAVGVLVLVALLGGLLDRRDAEVMARAGELQVEAAERDYLADLKKRGQLDRVAKGAARAERRENAS
jgi:hypothetical protein